MTGEMGQVHRGVRGRLIAVVVVLIVLLPMAIFLYVYSFRQTLTRSYVGRQLRVSIVHCYELRSNLEDKMLKAHRWWFPGVEPGKSGASQVDLFLYTQTDLPVLAQYWLREITSGDEMIAYAVMVDQRGRVITSAGKGRTVPLPLVLQVPYGASVDAVLERLMLRIEQDPAATQAVFFPAKLGGRYMGGIHIGIKVEPVAGRVQSMLAAGNKRFLRLSLFGTAMLALLAAYIVQLNETTRQLQSQLEKEQQMGSVGRLAAGLAHEIRTPLNALKMNMQMLQDRLSGTRLDDEQYIHKRLDYICREASRLEVSVDDFLSLARPLEPQKTPSDINRLVDDVVEFMKPQCASQGVEIVTDYDESLPTVAVDEAQVGQIVQNLIRNARQALGGQGRITVATAAYNKCVEIRVSDNGPGVPAADRERIFEVFYTTKADGTGLGLSIVKRIAEAHGGKILLDNAPGGGAMFTVRFKLDA